MNDSDDRNYISVGHWMGLMFLTAIPCVGLLIILVLAFVGENESRKNYFRAMIAWFFILVAICVAVALLSNAGHLNLPFNLKTPAKPAT